MRVPPFNAMLAAIAIMMLAIPGQARITHLVRGRYLLQDDAERPIAQAEASAVLK